MERRLDNERDDNPEAGDVMGDIEHWAEHLARNTLPECKAQAVCVNGRHCLDAKRCLRSGEIAVVPAADLEGAVEALQEVHGYLVHDERDAALVLIERACEVLGVDPDPRGGQ